MPTAKQYTEGGGVPQDDVEAYKWWNIAAAHSTNDEQKDVAAENRDEVARSMTPAQIAEAERISQQCQTMELKGC